MGIGINSINRLQSFCIIHSELAGGNDVDQIFQVLFTFCNQVAIDRREIDQVIGPKMFILLKYGIGDLYSDRIFSWSLMTSTMRSYF